MTPMEIIGIVVLALHGLVVFSLILWFGLGKPKTMAQFRMRFMRDFFGVRPKTAPRA
jgi:hypothetical protein